jgi:hypothetical protein
LSKFIIEVYVSKNMDTLLTIISIVGFLLTVAGFIIALIQTMKNRQLQAAMDQLKRHDEAEIWAMIGIVVKTFESLDDARTELFRNCDNGISSAVISKLSSARRGTIDQYKHLLKEASLLHESFSLDTIKQWISSGRLENKWRVEQALRLLPATEAPNTPFAAGSLLDEYQPVGHGRSTEAMKVAH